MTRPKNDSTEMTKSQALPDNYPALLQALKQRIRESQLRASVAVNRELVLLYWRIGQDILVRQERERWGAKIIDRLAAGHEASLPCNEGLLAKKPQVHASFR